VPHSRLKGLVSSFILAAAIAAAAHGQTANVTVDTTAPVRQVDEKVFGLNTAVWDGAVYSDPQTVTDLQEIGARFLRYPGGSSSDDFHWQTNTAALEGGNAGANTFDTFAASALSTGAQVVITANYGTGTPQEAAAWVAYSKSKSYGFEYWEVGNECYGTWEDDTQALPHDPYTYATRAVQYIQQMKAADPTIKVGVVAVTGEDSNSNGYSAHPATNPRTNVAHNGWTPVMLATMESLGVLPDYLIYHRYEQNPGSESDTNLLQAALTWPQDAASLRQLLTDYLGASGAGVQLLVTENNSVNTGPGKQTVSVVNGLYMADSIANVMQTEFNSLAWWALYNGPGTTYNNGSSTVSVNLSASLYGWREYGDYGVENGSGGSLDPTSHDRYPTFYVMKLLSNFARGGDTVVKATSDNTLLSTYAVHRQDDSLTLLVINKSPSETYNANIAVKGYTPQANAKVYSYGIPQDDYSEEVAGSPSTSGVSSSWENSMDGWVNQSGPDVAASNYGLDAPFAYSIGYSITTGVTNGIYSLACTTTASGLGDHAVIQNSTAAMGTALSTASSVSFNVYPAMTASGGTAQVSIYINGINIPYAEITPVNLVLNQENSVTFSLTPAQRAGILASLGTGDWFQIGININASNPLTVYFDNFQVTPIVTPTPTPTPTPITGAATSPDIAVSTISNAAATFTAIFAPYSATVISLTKTAAAPAFASQPSSQTVASGSTVVFSAPATGEPLPTYQWFLNGTAIPSANNPTLVIGGVTSANAGSYTCSVANESGALTSNAAVLNVIITSNPGRLINISSRAIVETGGNILIAGFVVQGGGSKSLILRGVGPTLGTFGVSGTLAAPVLSFYDAANPANLITQDSGWQNPPSVPAGPWSGKATPLDASLADFTQVGAFALTAGSADSAIRITVPAGGYTSEIAGTSNGTGVALAEVYDADTGSPSTQLVNISSRAFVGTGGNILIAGFVVSGSTSQTVLIRASGPALAAFGVPGTLPDPQLKLYDINQNLITSNFGWGGKTELVSAAASAGAFPWSNPLSNDSAILITLPPGEYTAQASGASGDTGVALVEVYAVR
jgi:hypothetical protein